MPQPPTPGVPAVARRLAYDVVVIGAGVAGLAFTLRLPPDRRVALLTKGVLGESNTRYAQGGLAAAVGPDDDPALHEADTLAAGAGLCDPAAVRRLVDGAPEAVRWLVGLGARFDADGDGRPLLGREAAHSRRRVLHAGGDATGAEIERALVARVREDPHVDLFEGSFAIDLLVDEGRCKGVLALVDAGEGPVALDAPTVVLAAGGTGQLWAVTSNPAGATADGLGMAIRAGVAVADLEFVQFHPTVLAAPDGEPFLISEAVRGEGAYLRGADGERFMPALHPLAELAPRDVVARGIQRQMALDGRDAVALDLRHLDAAATRARFPTIGGALAARGLDLTVDPIPVAPAAHYFMGGVVAGPTGTTSLPSLLALGEAACTGVHGANRLASNSLLEGLVFGLAAADALGQVAPHGGTGSFTQPGAQGGPGHAREGNVTTPHDFAVLRDRLRRVMSRSVGVVRDGAGLAEAAREIDAIADRLDRSPAIRPGSASETEAIADRRERASSGHPGATADESPGPEAGSDAGAAERERWVLRNMLDAAAAIVAAAARREESRGAHFRSDLPEVDPALAGMHAILDRGAWQIGPLADVLGGKGPGEHRPQPAGEKDRGGTITGDRRR